MAAYDVVDWGRTRSASAPRLGTPRPRPEARESSHAHGNETRRLIRSDRAHDDGRFADRGDTHDLRELPGRIDGDGPPLDGNGAVLSGATREHERGRIDHDGVAG